MNHAREAIGAVQCEPSLEGASALASAHKATPGVNLRAGRERWYAPLHFPLEPLGVVLEKLDAENSRGEPC
jgi:hypothetical protein